MKEDLKESSKSFPAGFGAAGDTEEGQKKHPLLQALSTEEMYLDLSYKGLNHLPSNSYGVSQNLEFLYLQGNNLTELPNDLFTTFPMMRRLDLRFNNLESLPASVGNHKCLEVLLVQDNCLQTLPKELGNTTRLRRLQLSGNPLTWPPQHILSGGVQAILSFLRNSTETQQVIAKCSTNNIDVHDKEVYEERQLAVSDKSHSFPKNKKTTNRANWKRKQQSVLIGNQSDLEVGFRSKENVKKHLGSGHALAVLHGKRFPLGYSKRCCSSTGAKIYKALVQQLWMDQLKHTLESQDHALQKLKDRETLLKWRRKSTQMQRQVRQQTGSLPPYDFDAAYLKMITRDGLRKGESLERKGRTKPSSFKVLDCQEKMNQLIASFDDLKSSVHLGETEPAKRRQLLAEEIEKIRKLQQAVQALRLV